MKKFLVLAAILALVLAGCDNSDGGVKGNKTTLTIRNLTDYTLWAIQYGTVTFPSIGIGGDQTRDVSDGVRYVYFVMIGNSGGEGFYRTDAVTCEEGKNTELILTNNTLVTNTLGDENIKDTIRNMVLNN